MVTTPIWVQLLVPFIGGLAGGGGVTLFGRWRKERRGRAVDARRDHARTFEQRSTAYVELIQELQAASDSLNAIHLRGRRPDLVGESQERVRAKMAAVEIFGSRKVAKLGWRAWNGVLVFESSLVLQRQFGVS
jgi:hypothetical protein